MSMVSPKILVGCPTHEVKDYCLELYAKAVKSLTYKNFDVLLVDNSPNDAYLEKIKSFGLNAIKGPGFETAIKRIIASRNLLRKHFLENDYDYLFSLEQDVLPPPDAIEKLLQHKKKIISGVYFNVQRNLAGKVIPLAMLWSKIEGSTGIHLSEEFIFDKPGLHEVVACGMGSVLIAREVVEKIPFRAGRSIDEGWDDMFFCGDANRNGFKIFANTSVMCQHVTTPKGKWAGIKKF